MSATRRLLAFGAATSAVAVTLLAASPDNPVGYVARAALYQGALLWGRVPLAEAEAALSPERVERLRQVPPIKRWARDALGLAHTENYDTIHPSWDRTIWNLSACEPLSFRPRTWWFPIVGRVPYLGFFDRVVADERARRLQSDGYELWVRPAGAYSTLGWFRDPVLPGMLDWSEHRLADTLVHELTHATVWVRGSAAFNESFANFVGERAGPAWLAHAYGTDSAEHQAAVADRRDVTIWRELLRTFVLELEAVYASDAADDAKLAHKEELFASLPGRARAAGFSNPDRYERTLSEPTWNNARLIQFRTYHRGYRAFEVLLDQSGGDLGAFVQRIRVLSQEGGDPWKHLSEATGVPDEFVQDS